MVDGFIYMIQHDHLMHIFVDGYFLEFVCFLCVFLIVM